MKFLRGLFEYGPVIAVVIFTLIFASALGFRIYNNVVGNVDILDTNYTFTKAEVEQNGEIETYKIKQWRDYENSDMIQFTTEDGTVILTHSVNVILYSE